MSFNNSDVIAHQGGKWEMSVNTKTIKNFFNSVSSISSGMLTTIISYTAINDTWIGFLEVSGTDIAQYEIYINNNLNALKRTYYGNLNLEFNFLFSGQSGLIITPGDIIEIKVIHYSLDLGNFEARIVYAE